MNADLKLEDIAPGLVRLEFAAEGNLLASLDVTPEQAEQIAEDLRQLARKARARNKH